jgi:hypothetical protein
MLFNPKYDDGLARLEEQLSRADAINSELLSAVMAIVCARFRALGSGAKAAVDRMIEAGAWTDAALTLFTFELPQWTLRRLVCEDGEWLCSLSKYPALPFAYDEAAEASHEILPLAILLALLQARRAFAPTVAGINTVPQTSSVSNNAVCCENFS